MPAKRLTDELCQAAVDAINKHGSTAAAARALGIPRGTLCHREREAVTRGIYTKKTSGERAKAAVEDKWREEAHSAAADVQRLRQRIGVLEAALECERAKSPIRVKPAADPKRRKGDKVRLIIPDIHGCFADKEAVGAMLADARRLEPDEVIILGDLVDCGGFLAQHHVIGYVADADYTYSQDLAAANHILDEIQDACKGAEFHYLEGNHEARAEAWAVTQALRKDEDADLLLESVSPRLRLRLEERGVKYYSRGDYHDGSRIGGAVKLGHCWFVHATSHAQNAAAKHAQHFGAPVVFGHTHRIQSHGASTVNNGESCAWSVGCLCVLRRRYHHSSPHDWQHGYGVQFVRGDGSFQHVTVHIDRGRSMLQPLLARLDDG